MKQCIENPNDVDWGEYWALKLEDKVDKDWDKAAEGFYKRSKTDDYEKELFSNLILDENDTVLDIGCGEGTITIPLARKVKKVIGLDSSEKMLEYLKKRADNENVDNIETILKPIEEIKYSEIGDVDVVVASRSMNGIVEIEKIITELNHIANKYVFITLFGPENKKIEYGFDEYMGIQTENFPGYNYLFNILYNMGIYANITRFEMPNYRKYKNIDEAINNGKFRLDLYSDEEKEKLKDYLNEILTKDPETGELYNIKDKADWVLIWWKK